MWRQGRAKQSSSEFKPIFRRSKLHVGRRRHGVFRFQLGPHLSKQAEKTVTYDERTGGLTTRRILRIDASVPNMVTPMLSEAPADLHPAELTGGCACGAVRFTARRLRRSGLCHCMMCRKSHAAAFSPFVVLRSRTSRSEGRCRVGKVRPGTIVASAPPADPE